jgi:predicted TIM-barrel fold metal-dependent hydrolase
MVGISAIGHFSREAFPYRDMEPFAAALFDAFGPDSIVPGSDYPLLEESDYAEYMRLSQGFIRPGNTQGARRFESSLFGTFKTLKE